MNSGRSNSASPSFTPAQEALQRALVALLIEKPLERIGVKELCAWAHVARSTFYAYYQNVDSLLAEVEDVHVAAIDAFNEPVADPSVDTLEPQRSVMVMDAGAGWAQSPRPSSVTCCGASPSRPSWALAWRWRARG